MGTLSAQSLIDRASELLLDDDPDSPALHWPASKHLGWLSYGQLELVNIKPEAGHKRATEQLAAGTRQSLPADAIDLIEAPRNMGGDGLTPGAAITVVSLSYMNQALPDWHTHPASRVVEHLMFDDREQRVFHVYPPQPAPAGYVELVYSARPAFIALIANPISLDDEYAPALVDYLMYRAHQKTSKRGELVKSGLYWQAFLTKLGVKEQAERGIDPRARTTASA